MSVSVKCSKCDASVSFGNAAAGERWLKDHEAAAHRSKWEDILDSSGAVPTGLLGLSWQHNRKELLSWLIGQYPDSVCIELLNAVIGNSYHMNLIWAEPPKAKKPQQPQPEPVNVETLTIGEIQRRAKEKELAEQQALDLAQRLNVPGRMNHAHPEPPPTEEQEAARKAELEAMREKQRRLDLPGHGLGGWN